MFRNFNTEVGGLVASRWLFEGKYLQREKEDGEGGGLGAGCSFSFFSPVSLFIIFITEVFRSACLRWLTRGQRGNSGRITFKG